MTDSDGLRQQIADTLCELPRVWIGDFGPSAIADAVLPVVTAWAEQQARQRAVQELRAAAENLREPDGWLSGRTVGHYEILRARADALTAGDPV